MSGPLDGLVIADFTQLAQGPFSTQLFGDMGAEIIKIEPPKGDWMRHWSMANLYLAGEGASFLSFNRNKRSIALDLKHPEGKAVALRLIGAADVVIENFRPGVMARLGLGYETLAERDPRLIYCASSGWGQSGPYVTRPGQDLLVQAVSGVGYLNGSGDGPPEGIAVGIADFTAGFHIVYGILAALYARERTGKGQRVDVNLLNSIMNLHIQEISLYLNGARLRGDPRHPGDGRARPDPGRFSGRLPHQNHRRVARPPAGRGYLVCPVNDFAALERDPQVAENEMIVDWEHPTAGRVRGVGMAVKFSGTPGEIARHAPLLGEHTVELLRQYGGYDDTEIAALLASGTARQLDMTGAPPSPR
jgi:crotonobetainyl-CoA:carnitine CoA-transferase CaiB-like acyl-CoA transferase